MHILFTVTDFDLGGITASLKNISKELILRGHKVSVLNLPGGANDIGLDENVNIIPLDNRSQKWGIGITDYKNARGFKKLKLLLFGIFKKLLFKFGLWEKFIFAKLPVIDCDAAVAYRQNQICYYICQQKTTAKKTIAFIHSDFDGDCSAWLSGLDGMSYIACVSNAWSEKFKKTFPHLQDKVHTVYNVFNASVMLAKAAEFYPPEYQSGTFKMVTVARLDFGQKRLDLVPEICKKLVGMGITDFKWYIVGDGNDKQALKEKIAAYKLENHIILTGAKSNPYPYIKNSDLFVLISDFESYGMVIEESKILGVPIVASKYPALKEIMTDNIHGIITETDINSIVSGLIKIYNDKALYQKLKTNCENYEYNSDIVYNQFIQLCD